LRQRTGLTNLSTNSTDSYENSQLFHIISPVQFSRTLLDELCELTTAARTLAKSRHGARALQMMLADRRAMLYFSQPSTRTFLSFNNACHILGIRTSEIRDASTSSEVKGESLEDSIRTFSSYVDVIIMRTWEQGLAQRAADLMDRIPRRVPIVNAGSGRDHHPTQALLDIYTLDRSFRTFQNRDGIDEKVIGLVGDLKRGRTARSLAYLMKNYRNVKLVFISPDEFKMEADIKSHLDEHGVSWVETDSLRDALPELDAVYMTRLQSEHDVDGESSSVDYEKFSFRVKDLQLLPEQAIIMHPLPRGGELAAEIDDDPRAMYWRQERNGMWMRVAALLKVFDATEQFRAIHADHTITTRSRSRCLYPGAGCSRRYYL